MRDAARHSVAAAHAGPAPVAAPRAHGNGGDPPPFETWDPGPIGWDDAGHDAAASATEGRIEPPDLLPQASAPPVADEGDEGDDLSPP
jgi:hypothetical protein